LPVYEYRCQNGHEYELTEGFDAPNQHKCQQCGKLARRQISVPAVIFKGSGFYSTDNRSGSRRNGGSSSDSSSDSSDSTPAASASSSDDGHGHSHGPGGHSHDSKPKVESSVD
jgi:putative FmdB family regulatory protein